MAYVEVAREARLRVHALPPEQRTLLEESKARRQLDEILGLCLLDIVHSRPALARGDPEMLQEAKEAVADSIDLVLAMIAYCDDVNDVARATQIMYFSGRRRKNGASIPTDLLWPKLKEIFHEVDNRPGRKNNALVHSKVKSAIALINLSYADVRTRFD